MQALKVLPVPVPANVLAPTLSQLSSCLMEVRVFEHSLSLQSRTRRLTLQLPPLLSIASLCPR